VPRVALKIAYDGTVFHGQARQPNLRTVEGEVITALRRARAIRDARSSRFQSASRTDAGVSALGNVVAFDTPRSPAPVARAFNAKARGVWAWAAASVPEGFSARRALERWYRYGLPLTHSVEALGAALLVFVGEHDFHNFTRDRDRTVVRIDGATAGLEGGEVVLDFRGPSFRWNLVRRLVSAALRVEAGDATIEDLERALRGRAKADLGLAPPEPLTLMDVGYGFGFDPVGDGTTAARVGSLLAERARGTRFLEQLSDRFVSP
jgi:tRNA pseudouridine38-40 synthase